MGRGAGEGKKKRVQEAEERRLKHETDAIP